MASPAGRGAAAPAGRGPGPELPLSRAFEALQQPVAAATALSEQKPAEGCKHYGCGGSFVKSRPCQCNSGCRSFSDCCSDFGSECADQVAPPPPPPEQHQCHARSLDRSSCTPPRIHSPLDASQACTCPPPLVPDRNASCNECHHPEAPQRMTFYMYRAQGKSDYPMANVNMGDLAGVLWYLHREVVGSTPRKFHITRIRRFSVTIKITKDHFKKYKKQFGPFVAFDAGSAKGRNHIWRNYGFVVGCQLVDPKLFNYVPPHSVSPACRPRSAFPCRAPKWYSLPGPCPEMKEFEKTAACQGEWPGGLCPSAVVTGDHTCTYFPAPAGEISINELEGIDSYKDFWIGADKTTGARVPNGNMEYNFKTDAGVGMHFWDGRHDKDNCTRRMERITALFKKKYPSLPETLPEPPCL